MAEVSGYSEAFKEELLSKIKDAQERLDLGAAARVIRQASLAYGYFDAQGVEDLPRQAGTNFFMMAYEIPNMEIEYGFLPQEPDLEMPYATRLVLSRDGITIGKVLVEYGLDYLTNYALLAGSGLSFYREGTTASLAEQAWLN